jgi:hypothetical protein
VIVDIIYVYLHVASSTFLSTLTTTVTKVFEFDEQLTNLTRVQMLLLAANPKEYAGATGMSDAEAQKCFGQVRASCVTVAETGFPLRGGSLTVLCILCQRLGRISWSN